MDSNRSKRRSSFPKSKLIRSFYRAATKPSGAAVQPSTSSAPVGFIIVKQDQVYPQTTSKVAFVMSDRNGDSYGKLENFYGGGGDDEEGVDAKAGKYISSVQERFRLERVNSERKNVQDIYV